METLQNLYDKALAGHISGWAYLPLKTMIEKNGEALTRKYLEKEIAQHKRRDESPLHKATFSIDGQGHYPGWTTLRTWNGWAMPLFERRVADEIAAELNLVSSLQTAYDPKRDAYVSKDVVNDPDGDEQVDAGEIVETPDGESLELYPLGSGSWVWDEDESKKED